MSNIFLSARNRAFGRLGDLKRHKFQHVRNVIRDGRRPTKIAHQEWCKARRASYKQHRISQSFNDRRITVNSLISGQLYRACVRTGHCDLAPYIASLGCALPAGTLLWIMESISVSPNSEDLVLDPFAVGFFTSRQRLLIEAVLIMMHDVRSKPDRLTGGRVMPQGGSRREVDWWYYSRMYEFALWTYNSHHVSHVMRNVFSVVSDVSVGPRPMVVHWWNVLHARDPARTFSQRALDYLASDHRPGNLPSDQGIPERLVKHMLAEDIAVLYPCRFYRITLYKGAEIASLTQNSTSRAALERAYESLDKGDYLERMLDAI